MSQAQEDSKSMAPSPERIARAFDREAGQYARFESHPTARFMRAAVHRVYDRYLKPGDRVLDLNCGPGPDFPYFRSRGCRVTGVDVSPRMLAGAAKADPEARLLEMDFNQLGTMEERFDVICSNFGGLNTQGEFSGFAAQCRDRLVPCGYLMLNIMTPLPWMEIAEGILHRRHFFRRLRHGGVQVIRVGEERLPTWYFYPGRWYRRFFKQHFELLSITGLGVFLPPPYSKAREGHLFTGRCKLESLLGGWFPFNRFGDHALLTMRARA